MPSPEESGRYQKAVLFEIANVDNYNEPLVYDAVELDVRWEDTQQEATKADGTVVGIDAIVVVNQVIPIGSILWRGALADLPADYETATDLDLRQALFSELTPDIKGRKFLKSLLLSRFSGKLPEIVGTGS